MHVSHINRLTVMEKVCDAVITAFLFLCFNKQVQGIAPGKRSVYKLYHC